MDLTYYMNELIKSYKIFEKIQNGSESAHHNISEIGVNLTSLLKIIG